ncbi:MAG TPA: GMC family oxidoreductase [Streptosporangiaceae bacterium]|nr:GMC family oxidoreductase [Streptosporangiaceae bacterium]
MSTAAITADVVVLGGGTAGCVVAAEAIRAGLAVVLVEAGPDYGRRDSGRWPAELLEPWTLPASHGWNFAETLPGGRILPIERGKVMGGCSSVNGCVAAWGSEADYNGWESARGLAGWGADAFRPELEAVDRALGVRQVTPDHLTPFQAGCLRAAMEIGFDFQEDVNDLASDVGVGTVPRTVTGRTRYNAAFAFLDDLRRDRRLLILAGHLVDKLEIRGNVVTAIRVIGPAGPVRLAGGLVILAAGVFGSPAILMRSGVGQPAMLGRVGIKPVLPLPGVGANLHDHPTVDVRFAGSAGLEKAMAAWLERTRVAEEPIVVKARSSLPGDAFDLHVFPVAETPFEGRAWGWVLPIAGLTPRSRGTVRLTAPDPDAPPAISHAFLSDEAGYDVRMLADGIDLARRMASAPGLSALIGEEIEPRLTGPELAAWIRGAHHHYWHPVGTCRMGPSGDPAAVTGPDGRVRGLVNCLVADASAMPAVPRANTNLPTAALARKIARGAFAAA